MIIYLDENMPPHLARGFNILQYPEGLKSKRNIDVIFLPDDLWEVRKILIGFHRLAKKVPV